MNGPQQKKVEDMYLGDGVYAAFDGWGIQLDLRAQDNTTRIYLEPSVQTALDRYRDICYTRKGPKT